MRVILGGHWCSPPEGWTALTEQDQDILSPLRFADSSLDAVFTEHVIEHVSFAGAVSFFKEALRCLRPGGVLRTVAPMADCFAAPDEEYCRTSIRPWFVGEANLLSTLGVPLSQHGEAFLLNSMYRLHGHQFIWTRRLLVDVLTKVGFVAVYPCPIGESRAGVALERRLRGHAAVADHDSNQNVALNDVYDPESGVVEARK